MATISVVLTQPAYGFTATDDSGKTVTMDTSPEGGGQHYGVRPMQNMLAALGGCSGIDIVSILAKQRQQLESLTIRVDGEREKDKTPALWKKAHMTFEIGGAVQPEKAVYAAKLSVEKYCSVAETLRRAGCTITWEVRVNGEAAINQPVE